MVLVVEKFGGSSVSDAAKIRHVAGRIATRVATSPVYLSVTARAAFGVSGRFARKKG